MTTIFTPCICTLFVTIIIFLIAGWRLYSSSGPQTSYVEDEYNITSATFDTDQRVVTPAHTHPYLLSFEGSKITIYDVNKTGTKLQELDGIVILKRNQTCKSRGIMIKAGDISLWNSSIKFYSCFIDDETGKDDCQLWFN